MPTAERLSRLPCGRVSKWLVVVFWIVVFMGTGSLSAKLASAQQNDAAQWLPGDAESTRTLEITQGFLPPDTYPALVVYNRPDGSITTADREKAAADARRIAGMERLRDGEMDARVVRVDGPRQSEDGKALQTIVQIKVGERGWIALGPIVKDLRDVVKSGDGQLQAHVAGQAGFQADSSESLTGLDGTLLAATVLVVVVILVLTYRSPVLWLLPLLGSFVALNVAQAIIYGLVQGADLTVTGSSSFILTVLVLGVGTDYTLLIVSRYREELRRERDRHLAMAAALRRSVLTVAASAGTVVLAMLCLLAADLNSTQSLGPVTAVGVVVTFCVMTTLLPALLVICGRWLFWPVRPALDTGEPHHDGLWARIGARIAVRPRLTWIVAVVVLGVMAGGLFNLNAGGFSGDGSFRNEPDSVIGQEVNDRHFAAGAGSPVQIVARSAAADEVAAAVSGVQGVAGAGDPIVREGHVYIEATLAAPPGSSEAYRTIDRLRAEVHEIPGADAMVGGGDAVNLDVRRAAEGDRAVVIPLVLLGILALLILALRAVIGPIVLVATVLLAFAAALGLSALLFDVVFGFDATDPSFPLWAFVFLVALGVDYNIFLATRMREEAARRGPRAGVLAALAATGGVITSAGVVVAGTFGALAVLPLVFMAEIGVAVAIGVLLDTFVVRSVLVSAIALDLGRWMWWPGRLARPAAGPGAGEVREAEPAPVAD